MTKQLHKLCIFLLRLLYLKLYMSGMNKMTCLELTIRFEYIGQ